MPSLQTRFAALKRDVRREINVRRGAVKKALEQLLKKLLNVKHPSAEQVDAWEVTLATVLKKWLDKVMKKIVVPLASYARGHHGLGSHALGSHAPLYYPLYGGLESADEILAAQSAVDKSQLLRQNFFNTFGEMRRWERRFTEMHMQLNNRDEAWKRVCALMKQAESPLQYFVNPDAFCPDARSCAALQEEKEAREAKWKAMQEGSVFCEDGSVFCDYGEGNGPRDLVPDTMSIFCDKGSEFCDEEDGDGEGGGEEEEEEEEKYIPAAILNAWPIPRFGRGPSTDFLSQFLTPKLCVPNNTAHYKLLLTDSVNLKFWCYGKQPEGERATYANPIEAAVVTGPLPVYDDLMDDKDGKLVLSQTFSCAPGLEAEPLSEEMWTVRIKEPYGAFIGTVVEDGKREFQVDPQVTKKLIQTQVTVSKVIEWDPWTLVQQALDLNTAVFDGRKNKLKALSNLWSAMVLQVRNAFRASFLMQRSASEPHRYVWMADRVQATHFLTSAPKVFEAIQHVMTNVLQRDSALSRVLPAIDAVNQYGARQPMPASTTKDLLTLLNEMKSTLLSQWDVWAQYKSVKVDVVGKFVEETLPMFADPNKKSAFQKLSTRVRNRFSIDAGRAGLLSKAQKEVDDFNETFQLFYPMTNMESFVNEKSFSKKTWKALHRFFTKYWTEETSAKIGEQHLFYFTTVVFGTSIVPVWNETAARVRAIEDWETQFKNVDEVRRLAGCTASGTSKTVNFSYEKHHQFLDYVNSRGKGDWTAVLGPYAPQAHALVQQMVEAEKVAPNNLGNEQALAYYTNPVYVLQIRPDEMEDAAAAQQEWENIRRRMREAYETVRDYWVKHKEDTRTVWFQTFYARVHPLWDAVLKLMKIGTVADRVKKQEVVKLVNKKKGTGKGTGMGTGKKKGKVRGAKNAPKGVQTDEKFRKLLAELEGGWYDERLGGGQHKIVDGQLEYGEIEDKVAEGWARVEGISLYERLCTIGYVLMIQNGLLGMKADPIVQARGGKKKGTEKRKGWFSRTGGTAYTIADLSTTSARKVVPMIDMMRQYAATAACHAKGLEERVGEELEKQGAYLTVGAVRLLQAMVDALGTEAAQPAEDESVRISSPVRMDPIDFAPLTLIQQLLTRFKAWIPDKIQKIKEKAVEYAVATPTDKWLDKTKVELEDMVDALEDAQTAAKKARKEAEAEAKKKAEAGAETETEAEKEAKAKKEAEAKAKKETDDAEIELLNQEIERREGQELSETTTAQLAAAFRKRTAAVADAQGKKKKRAAKTELNAVVEEQEHRAKREEAIKTLQSMRIRNLDLKILEGLWPPENQACAVMTVPEGLRWGARTDAVMPAIRVVPIVLEQMERVAKQPEVDTLRVGFDFITNNYAGAIGIKCGFEPIVESKGYETLLKMRKQEFANWYWFAMLDYLKLSDGASEETKKRFVDLNAMQQKKRQDHINKAQEELPSKGAARLRKMMKKLQKTVKTLKQDIEKAKTLGAYDLRANVKNNARVFGDVARDIKSIKQKLKQVAGDAKQVEDKFPKVSEEATIVVEETGGVLSNKVEPELIKLKKEHNKSVERAGEESEMFLVKGGSGGLGRSEVAELGGRLGGGRRRGIEMDVGAAVRTVKMYLKTLYPRITQRQLLHYIRHPTLVLKSLSRKREVGKTNEILQRATRLLIDRNLSTLELAPHF